MNTPVPTNCYKHHRFPVEIISHAVSLYFRFRLSSRGVKGFLFARGIRMSQRSQNWQDVTGRAAASPARPIGHFHLPVR
jgi:putative transposase